LLGWGGPDSSNDLCLDVNECMSNSGSPSPPCEQGCINTDGSYSCFCNAGFTLGANGVGCDDVNECLTGNGGCPDVCVNTFGSYNCTSSA
jgi:hypothetical protein